jgi:hypothetical protein
MLAKEPSTPSETFALSVVTSDDVLVSRESTDRELQKESLLLPLLPPSSLFGGVCFSIAQKMSETTDPADSHLSHVVISGTRPEVVYVEDSLRVKAGGGSSNTALIAGDLGGVVGMRAKDDDLDKTGVWPSRFDGLLTSYEPHDLEREKCERDEIGADAAAGVVAFMVGFERGRSIEGDLSRFCQLRNFITPSRSIVSNDIERLFRGISPLSEWLLLARTICPA